MLASLTCPAHGGVLKMRMSGFVPHTLPGNIRSPLRSSTNMSIGHVVGLGSLQSLKRCAGHLKLANEIELFRLELKVQRTQPAL